MSIELTTIGSFANQSSMLGPLNTNFEKLEQAINELYSQRNTLSYPLDCNGQALMNAVLSNSAVLGDITVNQLILTLTSLLQRIEALEAKRP